MSLSAGDIFEGAYQLEERLEKQGDDQVTRWRADDVTAYRKSEVVIDLLPYAYDASLHWQGKVPGLKKIGQSVEANCRYLVWEPGKVPAIARLDWQELSEQERKVLGQMLDALPVAAHETILPEDLPELWRAGTDGHLLFYRKHDLSELRQTASFQQKQDVRELWKKGLSAPATAFAQPPEAPAEVPPPPPVATSTKWSVLTVGIGLVLAFFIYQRLPSKPSPGLTRFNSTLEKGMAEANKGAYESAVAHFEAAAAAPPAEEIDARLDSLAKNYHALARRECDRYQAAESTNLYFIADQYFHYAAILSRQPSHEKCQ